MNLAQHLLELYINVEVVELAGAGCRWRAARVGVNLEGVCNGPDCIADGERVVCAMGLGAWAVAADRLECPLCCHRVKPETCGLSCCSWKYEGAKVGPWPNLTVTRCEGPWKVQPLPFLKT